MKSSINKTNSEDNHDNANQLPVRWQKWDIILGNVILGVFGIIIGYFIHTQQIETNTRIAETTQAMEDLRAEISNKIVQGQLANSMIGTLLKGSESERLAAMFILENSTSDEFSETVFAAMAIWDKDERVRTEAIKILEKKGKSPFIQRILTMIKEKGVTKNEREAAIKAHEQVTKRAKNYLDSSLSLAREFYGIQLYQSAAEEFKKIENLLANQEIDEGELELAKVNYQLKNYKSAAEHYIKATEKIQ